jgi:hypothetical protein
MKTFEKQMLIFVIDNQVKQLSYMQIELMQLQGFNSKDYNEISELITDLKNHLINCHSYTNNEKTKT